MGISQFNESIPFVWYGHVLNSDGVGDIAIATAAVAPLRLDSLLVANSDNIDHVMRVGLAIPTNVNWFSSAKAVAGVGTAGEASYDIVQHCCPTTIGAIILPLGASLHIQMLVEMTAGSYFWFAVFGGYLVG